MAKLSQKPDAYLDGKTFATRAETMERLLANWQPAPGTETVPLRLAGGRVSAADVLSRNTLPVCRAADRDGGAVRFADFEKGLPDVAAWQEDRDYATADMGDDFDDAFDTVIQVEDFAFDEEGRITAIDLEDPVEKGQLVKQQGANLREGEQVLAKGDVINPYRVGLLASAGTGEVAVLARPRVAFLPTGSELVPAGQPPKRGQNVESNSLMTEAFLQRWGAECLAYPIVADQQVALEKALDDALERADIVLLNGGTSMGTEDYTSALLTRRASHYQHGVRCVPGLPVVAAMVDGKPVINLPGPPFAAFCALDWCVRGLVYHWQGQPLPQRRTVQAKLTKPIKKPPHFEMYVRLELLGSDADGYTATPMFWDVRNPQVTARWNGLFIPPIGVAGYEAGDVIEAEWLYTDC